jgi:hypothetical protein
MHPDDAGWHKPMGTLAVEQGSNIPFETSEPTVTVVDKLTERDRSIIPCHSDYAKKAYVASVLSDNGKVHFKQVPDENQHQENIFLTGNLECLTMVQGKRGEDSGSKTTLHPVQNRKVYTRQASSNSKMRITLKPALQEGCLAGGSLQFVN